MRASQLVCGSLLLAALFAAACGDDAPRRAPTGAGEAGDGNGAIGGSENQSGGSTNQAEAGGGSGGSAATAGSGMGGNDDCLIGPEEGQPDDYLYEFQSGTRLQARYYAADGMPDVFAGFFDSELGDWCDFMKASDDTLRCLPRSTAITGDLGFSDAECTKDVLTFGAGCSAAQPRIRRRLECFDKAEVVALEPYSGVPRVGSECTPTGTAAPAGAFTVGDEIPPSSFVAGQLVDLPGVCRASLRIVETADGARGPFQVFDIASGTACQNGGGCKPVRLAFEDPTLTSDDTCETPADPGYATWNDAESCGPPDFVRPVDAMIDGWYRAGPLSDAELYAAAGPCEPARNKDWIGSIYELGEVVPSDALVSLQVELRGEGALQVEVSSELGRPLISNLDNNVRLHHAELDVDCNLRQLSDGTLRCIPTDIVSGGGFQDEYNDSDCTVPIRRCTENCPGKLVFDESPDGEACSSERQTTAVWAYSEPATAYYRESPGFPCYAGGAVGPDMWTVEAIDPADLPEATLETAE